MQIDPGTEFIDLQARGDALINAILLALISSAQFVVQLLQLFAMIWIVCFITWRKWAGKAERKIQGGIELQLFKDAEPRGSRPRVECPAPAERS